MLSLEVESQTQATATGRDRLDMAYINSLPQPLWDRGFPVHDIDVETGMYRIDVCGMLDVLHINRVCTLDDATGKRHYVGDFSCDPDQWVNRVSPDMETPNVG